MPRTTTSAAVRRLRRTWNSYTVKIVAYDARFAFADDLPTTRAVASTERQALALVEQHLPRRLGYKRVDYFAVVTRRSRSIVITRTPDDRLKYHRGVDFAELRNK